MFFLSTVLLMAFVIRKWSTTESPEKGANFQDALQLFSDEERKVVLENRYKEKAGSKGCKDINRWGRWSCTLKHTVNGKPVVQTRIGLLSTCARRDVKTYHEIK